MVNNMLYAFLFVYIGLFAYLNSFIGQRKTFVWPLVFFLLILHALSVLKWETGGDWIPYISYYTENNSFGDFSSQFEIGYGAISFFAKSVSDSYTFFLFVFGSIIYILVGRCLFSRHLSSNRSLIALLFYAYFTGFIFFQRQSLAIALCFLGLIYILEDRKFSFVITVLAASLFHTSALIFFAAYPISKYKTKPTSILFFCLIAFGLYFLFNKSPDTIGAIAAFIPLEHIGSRVGEYIELSELDADFFGNSEFGNFTGIARKIFVIGILTSFFLKPKMSNPHFLKLYNIATFGALLYIAFGLALPPLKRLSSYFDIAEICALAVVIGQVKSRILRFLLLSLIVIYAAAKLYSQIYAYYELYIPFNTIFEGPANREMY